MDGKQALARMEGRPCRVSAAWRWLACGLALLHCSCQALEGPRPRQVPRGVLSGPAASSPAALPVGPAAYDNASSVQLAAYHPPSLPAEAWTGAPATPPGVCVSGCCAGVAVAPGPPAWSAAAWRPPGIAGIWPAQEYLFDGGDRPPPVEVLRDWTVIGLDAEDTVAHFDTLDGRTEVEPSNRVPIYAPRFAAVRSVSGIIVNEQHDGAAGVVLPTRVNLHEEQRLATTVHQPIQSERYLGLEVAQRFREAARPADVHTGILLEGIASRFRMYEDFQIIRRGVFEDAEKARLAVRLHAAHAWTSEQAVQVILDETLASLAVGSTSTESVYRYEMPEGKPRLRVVKIASQQQAQPGEELDFTIRYDNIGDQIIGNVTILDSLTTRLEYIPDSAESTRDANFITQENDVESLVLRWEILDPLPVGEGGVVRFRCRVR
jgi:uncharacterized repeat protein (TIGR01451 family)